MKKRHSDLFFFFFFVGGATWITCYQHPVLGLDLIYLSFGTIKMTNWHLETLVTGAQQHGRCPPLFSKSVSSFILMLCHLWQEGVSGGVDTLDQGKHGQIERRSAQRWHPESFSYLIGQEETGSRSSTLSMEARQIFFFYLLLPAT